MQGAIGQIASTAYENGSMTSPLGVLTAGSPQTLLAQSAILTHLSTSRQQQLAQVNLTARALADAKQTGQRTETAVASLKKQLGVAEGQPEQAHHQADRACSTPSPRSSRPT